MIEPNSTSFLYIQYNQNQVESASDKIQSVHFALQSHEKMVKKDSR